MDRKVAIPVRVIRPEPRIPVPAGTEVDGQIHRERQGLSRTPEAPPVREEARRVAPEPLQQESLPEPVSREAPSAPQVEVSSLGGERLPAAGAGDQSDSDEWRMRALRLQADMDNYRKRQRRLAQDQIESERQRLLQAFLPVVDDLDRALDTPPGGEQGLRRGVEMIRHQALQVLQQEGVQQIEAERQPFDPNWHEAVSSVPGHKGGVEPNTVVQVLDRGYRLGDRLLRPARVVVAV